MLNQFSLKDKVALITGASYGIGMAVAKALYKAGAVIIFNDISENLVDRGIESYQKENIVVDGYVCDITNETQVDEMIDQISSDIGNIDILVNNAGIIKHIPALEMSVRDFRQVVDIDLTGSFIMAKAVAPGMIEHGGGKIINVCSMMSESGKENVSAYASAKGGLKMLTKSLACEWAAYNIQVNGIGPGYIATPYTETIKEEKKSLNNYILSRTPAARWGTMDDLEGPVIFLASSASDFINGQILYVDGGVLAYIG